jgi:hypothetical protein
VQSGTNLPPQIDHDLRKILTGDMVPEGKFADASKTIEPEFHKGFSFTIGLWERTCYMPKEAR